jgi:hypothetical protein
MYDTGIQEQFRRCERSRFISDRKEQILEAASSPTVVVYDADHRDLERFQLEWSRRLKMSRYLPPVAMPMILPT